MRRLLLILALVFAPLPAHADDDYGVYRERLAVCIAAAQDEDALAACRGAAAQPCHEADGGTTHGMMLCLGAESQVWEETIQASLTRLRAERADVVDALNQTQTDWDAYVESACNYRVALWGEGSGARVELASCHAGLNAERAIALARDVRIAH